MKKLICFLLIALLSVGLSTVNAVAQEIEAAFTAEYGGSLSPIKIFDQTVNLGDTVSACLLSTPGTCTGGIDRDYWEDYLPHLDTCWWGPGVIRNADTSVISRVTLSGTERVLIIVRHAGGTGFRPGSQGFVKITSPDWKITRVLQAQADTIIVDRANQVITWSVRSPSTAAACKEGGFNLVFLVQKTTTPVKSQGDVNCDGLITLSDVIRTVNHIFNKPCASPPCICDPFAPPYNDP